MTYLLVFCSTFIADIVWARYIVAATERHTLRAAFWSAAIIALGGFNVTQYALNWHTVFPAIVGAFAGTWFALRCKD
jgi:predicted small integral membrane protein